MCLFLYKYYCIICLTIDFLVGNSIKVQQKKLSTFNDEVGIKLV